MKKNTIKKIMKTDIENHIPEKITINWDLVENERKLESIELQQKKSIFTPLKLGLSTVLSFVIILFIFVFFGNTITPPNLPSGQYVFETEKNVLTNSFVSTASLINTETSQLNQSSNQLLSMSQSQIQLLTINQSPFESLKPYLKMVENLITQENGYTTQVIENFDYPYETGIEVTSFDILGQPQSYQIFYDVISYEEDEEETSFEISGIMIFNGETYQMEGIKENDQEESKLEIIAYIDENNYIESSYETETDESKYIVSIYENGMLISEIEFKIEFDEDQEIEIDLTIKENFTISYYELEYFHEDGQNWIEANYQSQSPDSEDVEYELLILVLVDEITLETYYQVTINSDEESVIFDEERRGNDDDENEEDEDEEDEDEEDE
ncbi:MAG: hypothetical protein JXC35_03490, partial [Acholeplasmataceae bacterium]|nr:hypothetical protein [Acholeplasmataceae bacterium]